MVGTLGIAAAGAVGLVLMSRGVSPPVEAARDPLKVVVPAIPPAPVLVARPQPDQPKTEVDAGKVTLETPASDTASAAKTDGPSMLVAPEPRVVDRTPFGPSVTEGGGPEKAPVVDTPASKPADVESAPTPKESKDSPPEPKTQRAPALVTPRKINVNTATKAELELLPGVGPAIADRIIEARVKKRFNSFDDLDRVRGIGPKLLEKIRVRITFVDDLPAKPGK